ncbi:hypothetical protein [Pseudoalteromonas mariniglutinosa]|uniref:hypothetical protein n=1 Tax=Pseudoalteromonas mariniglutinosa TaxID=206042 RepID=UPI0038512E58
MKKSTIAALLAVFTVLLICLLSADDEAITATAKPVINAPVTQPKSVREKQSNTKQAMSSDTSAVKQLAFFNDDLTKAAQLVAIQYQHTLQFPPYSQPLTEADEDRLQANKFYPVTSPLDEQGGALTLNLEQYRYVYPEDIRLTVNAKGLTNIVVELTNTDSKDILATQKQYAQQDHIDVTFKAQEDYPRNLQVFVNANVSGKQVPVVAQIQYMSASATLTRFNNAYAHNENMVVTAQLTVIEEGLYRIRANLYVAGLPVAHLVAKKRLDEGKQTVDLKAHWSVLSERSRSLRLQDFVIERMSPSPAEPNRFGDSEIHFFDITDFAYDSLQQLPYQATEQEQQSLDFLNRLAVPAS